MEKLARDKPLFIGLSCAALVSLIGSFAYPLQKLEVWRQKEHGAFNLNYDRHFIITESTSDYPYGFDINKAVKVAQIYRDYKIEKISLLVIAIGCASTAIKLGHNTCIGDEIDSEVESIKSEGKKQLILEGIKHRLAMASKSQRLIFLDEMKALMEEFDSVESEIMDVDELMITGDESGLEDNLPVVNDFRHIFPESMDNSSWKVVLKGISDGLSADEIIKDILCCDVKTGESYLKYLKQRFLGI
ncbi:hypothetical protein [Limnofasciculus baicalensis]|uniref:Uncharacterized protein n=1 Tax=Limnofasciculus baicalensis BBK-W-15 TaxID=2699891 RepID=A0AAE3GSG9_9CYAN|nr:hypothetical protein [Limnofasciculus baicalensis]MCP2729866.1 hypothetical protein [Limnofasciculus baicalensis BBK-W-15]